MKQTPQSLKWANSRGECTARMNPQARLPHVQASCHEFRHRCIVTDMPYLGCAGRVNFMINQRAHSGLLHLKRSPLAAARRHASLLENNDLEAGMRQDNATCQDVLGAPPHMFAEVLAGKLHSELRPDMRHAWASSTLSGGLVAPFLIAGAATPAVRGSSLSRNCAWVTTLSHRTLQAGCAKRCPDVPMRPLAHLRPTWPGRCSVPRLAGSIGTRSGRSMPGKAARAS